MAKSIRRLRNQLQCGPALAAGMVLWMSLAAFAETPSGISAVDAFVEQAIAEGEMPGAVVLIGTKDRLLHRKAYGQRQIEPTPEAMTPDTVFDLASLTKPLVTATSVLLLSEQGKIDIAAPVIRYLPEFGQAEKETVTVAQLLTHTSGLIADNALRDYENGKEAAWKNICSLKLTAPPGEKFIYSDVSYITLGMLVERVSGQPLNEFSAKQIFQPLQMTSTGYLPDKSLQARSAPMNQEQGEWIRGIVHDPRARALGGVAGHAGVFSTADDLGHYARMVLHHGSLAGERVLKPETVDLMLTSRPVPGGIRTWGWDRQTGFSHNKGDGMSNRAIGHGGFTGTGLWIDPGLNLYVVFLSNRLHPDGKGAVNTLIGKIGTEAVRRRGARGQGAEVREEGRRKISP